MKIVSLLGGVGGAAVLAGVIASTNGIWSNSTTNGPNPGGNAYGLYGNSLANGNGRVAAVPIPGTLLLFGAGWVGFAAWRWRDGHRSK